MRRTRRGLVVYQLLLILLALALVIWLVITLVNRSAEPEAVVPDEAAAIDTAPVPVPVVADTTLPADSVP